MRMLLIRLRFLARRIWNWDPKRLTEFLGYVKKLSRKPSWILIPDMIWSAVVYTAPFEAYAQWDFFMLSGRERRTFMTDAKSAILSNRFNSQEHRVFFDHKLNMLQRFDAYLRREWFDVAAHDAAAFEAFVRRHGRVLAKEVMGGGGHGIEVIEANAVADFPALRTRLLEHGQGMLEQFLPQHEGMNRLNPGAVNTMRIITYLDPDDHVHVLTRCLKIGNQGVIDNYSGGGMYTMLDERGVAMHAAYDQENDIFETHPVTGTRIEGFQVPMFDELLAMMERLAREIPEMPYIGWDMAITPDGPALIEGNHNTGAFQSRPYVSGIRIGDYPRYKAAMRL